MYFNRIEAKRRAKSSMHGARPYPALVGLIYFLLTSLLSNIVLSLANPLPASWGDLLLMGEEELYYRISMIPTSLFFLFFLISALVTLYTCVMEFGFASYTLRLARCEKPGIPNLFDGFARAGRVILNAILTYVFVYLWTLLALIPFCVFFFLGALGGILPVLFITLSVVCLILAIIFSFSVLYRYRLSYYFLLDHPDMGPLQAITASKRAMKGNKWKLFVLDLSFLGWFILSSITYGILGIWVYPYYYATLANFYDCVVNGNYSTPDGANNLPYS